MSEDALFSCMLRGQVHIDLRDATEEHAGGNEEKECHPSHEQFTRETVL